MQQSYEISTEGSVLLFAEDMSQVGGADWHGGGGPSPPRYGPVYGPSGTPSWPQPTGIPWGGIARGLGAFYGGFALGFGAVTGWAASQLGAPGRDLDEIERRFQQPPSR